MLLVEDEQIVEMRELLRRMRGPFILRAYEAAPEDYEAIDDEDCKCEYLDGVIIMHSPASVEHERVVAFLVALLHDQATRHGQGSVFGSNAVMQLGERRFSPDLSFLSVAHEDRIRGGRVIGPMDLVVEVLSTNTRTYDRGEKLAAYHQGRVAEIWLVDPEEHLFEAYALRGDVYERVELTAGRWSSGVLPGLSLDAAWLWRRPLPTLDECRAAAGLA